MRATTILLMVIASVVMGSTPVSSLSALRVGHALRTCSPPISRMISLVGSQGAFGIVAVASRSCSP